MEVDGPFHFAVNTSSPLGQTMIRRRLLRASGWTVISVPCHAWWVGEGRGGRAGQGLVDGRVSRGQPQAAPTAQCRPPLRHDHRLGLL